MGDDMGLTDNLRRQHTEILKMAGEIQHLIGCGAVKNATALRGVLARLTGVVKVHLAMEDSSSYPLMLAAKIHAILDHRFHVSRDDLRDVALHVLRHRLILNFEGQADGVRPDDILKDVLRAA